MHIEVTQDILDLSSAGLGISDMSVDRRVQAIAALRPSQIAVECAGQRVSYAELEQRTQSIAEHLQKQGIGKDDRVGLYLERTPDLIAALLAVLRCGAAYVPLDPGFPVGRLTYMAQDARLSAVLTHGALAPLPADHAITCLVEEISSDVTGLTFDLVSPDAAAYILYTSGSTGQPKGVVIPHRALNNFVGSMQREPGVTAADRILAVTTLSFDIAVLELLVPLTVGARVVLAQREQAMDGRVLAQLIERHDINLMQATPTTWYLLLQAGFHAPAAFRALCGGEALPPTLAQQLLVQRIELWNLYGPTETTVWSTVQRIVDAAHITIGHPIDNTSVYILDEQQRPCEPGHAGEIYIGGTGVALGYWQRPELTAQRFVPDPYSQIAGARMYRTGDLGRWREDGSIEHLGRVDHQVKIRGYRIELGEIEARLTQVTGIARALVVARQSELPELVAYVIAERGCPVDPVHLRATLARDLPEYMLPLHFVELLAFPLLPNGKIDRNALPAPTAHSHVGRSTLLVTPTERALARIWQSLLSIDNLDAHDNFFRIGGHSLLAVRMLAAVERELHVNVPLSTLLRHPTCATLAAYIDSEISREPTRESWQPLVQIKSGSGQAPLFCIHAVGGNVLNYRVLADALPTDQTVYGLQALGLDGTTEPLHTVEAMAERYIAEIRSVQPSGPYYLCGGSMGGTIAFEMARQLRARNEDVALLALLDTWGPGLRHARRHTQASRAKRLWMALVSGKLTKRLRARIERRQVTAAIRRCRATGAALPQDLRWRYVTANNEAASNRYVEQRYDGSIVLLCAHVTQALGPADLGWKDVIEGDIEIVALPGEHKSFVEEPAVADALCTALLRAQHTWRWSQRRVSGAV